LADYFFTTSDPVDCVENFERSLFHQEQHLLLQSKSGWIKFYILDSHKKKVEAFFPVHVDDDKAVSPFKSSFGSIVFNKALPAAALYNFIAFIEDELCRLGVKEIWIKNPPVAYYPGNLNLLQVLFLNKGFSISQAEAGSVLTVNDYSFYSKITIKQQQKLKQAIAKGLSFTQIDIRQIEGIYFLLEKWQQQKGYTLSMTLNELRAVVAKFSNRFVITGVMLKSEVIAAAISIHVADSVLYNFYLSHNPTYNHLSPVVLLLDGLYSYCQKKSITLLDLGTSAANQQPNFSLLDFKQRLGAEFTAKLTFYKQLQV
jgi:hypothetical protein